MHRLITTLSGVLLTIAGSAQSELLRKYIEVQHQRMHFNGVVLVTKNNQPLYQVAVGKASHELNVPMGPRGGI